MKKPNNNPFKKAFGQEKLPINPFKRAKIKKRNAQKKLALQLMMATTAAGTAIGTGAGFGVGFITGRRGKKKNTSVDDIDDEDSDDITYGGVGENGDPIEGTPPPDMDNPDVYAVGIFPGTGSDCRVFDVKSDEMRYGLCFNGDETFDEVSSLMSEFEMEDADLLEIVYDFNESSPEIERVKASICSFCAKEFVPTVLLDSSRHEVLIQRVNEDGYAIDEDVLGSTEPERLPKPVPKPKARKVEIPIQPVEDEEEEDPYEGMNTLTDQSELGRNYPEYQVDEEEDDDDEEDVGAEIDKIVSQHPRVPKAVVQRRAELAKESVEEEYDEEGEEEEGEEYEDEEFEDSESEIPDEEDDDESREVEEIADKILSDLPESLDEYGPCSVKEEFEKKMDFNRDAFIAMFFRTLAGRDPFRGKKDPELAGTIVDKMPDDFNSNGIHVFFIDQAMKVYAMYCRNHNLDVSSPKEDTVIKGDITFLDLAYSIQTIAIKIFKRSHPSLDQRQSFNGFLRDLAVRMLQEILRTRIHMKKSLKEYAQANVEEAEEADREMLSDEFGHDPTEEPDPEDVITFEQEQQEKQAQQEQGEEPEEATEPAE